MKIGVVTDCFENLPSINESFDVFIVLGNFLPIYDTRLVTWNIVNQVDHIDNVFNPWLDKIKSDYKIILGGKNDHLAQFYGSQTSFYLSGDYLQDEIMTIKGINFYGMPWMPSHYYDSDLAIAFRSREGNFFNLAVESINDNVDILLTNVPPKLNFTSDDHKFDGDIFLSKKIESLKKIKFHLFSMCTSVDENIEKTIKHRSLCCSKSALSSRNFLSFEV